MINAQTGAVLYEKNAHMESYPASITKMATALFVLDKFSDHVEDKVVASKEALASITTLAKKQSGYRSPPYWLESDGAHIGIKAGEEFILRDLLYAMMVRSANDAANVIAQHIGGTIPRFMEALNGYLKEIGCQNTHFLNPHGLHHPDHTTTAYDQALIAAKAMKIPLFRQIVSTPRYTCPPTNLEMERVFKQTNLLLREGAYYYPYAIGIKTGTTISAGKTLVSAAAKEERELIAVILGAQNSERYEDSINLYETAFHEPKMRRYLLPKGAQKMASSIKGGKKKVQSLLPEGLFYDFYPAEETKVKATINWDLPPLPIKKGAAIGKIELRDARNNLLKITTMYAAEEVNPTLWYRLKAACKDRRKVCLTLFSGVLIFVLNHLRRKRGKRSTRPLF